MSINLTGLAVLTVPGNGWQGYLVEYKEVVMIGTLIAVTKTGMSRTT